MLKHLPGLVFVSFLLDSSSPASGSQVRLAGSGSTRCSGRVEIYHDNIWGTVCDDGWDINDAMVMCRQVDCGTALSALQSAHFGEGTGQVWINDVDCTGSEKSLSECQHSGFGRHDCGHSEDAGVICSVKIPKPSISMNPVGEVTWGQDVAINCSISTQYLGGTFTLKQTSGPARETQTSSSNSFIIHQVNFNNEGLYQCWYQTRVSNKDLTSPLSDSVRLSVTVNLPKPSISMNPVGEVTWGQDVAITCSISTQHLGGTFTLQQTSGSFRKTQTSSSNSATFNIRQVNFDNEGLYQCQYQTRISSQDFSSPLSDSVRLSVTVHLPLLVSSVAGSLVLLLVLVVICLVHKRRQQSEPGVISVNELAVRNVHVYSDDEEEEEQHYMNFDTVQSEKRQMKQTSEMAVKDSDNNYHKDKEESDEDADYENTEGFYSVENQEIYVSVETHSVEHVCDDGVDVNSCVPVHRYLAEDDLDIYGGEEKEDSDEDGDYENTEGFYSVENQEIYVSVETHSVEHVCDDGAVDDNSRPFAEDDLDIYEGNIYENI